MRTSYFVCEQVNGRVRLENPIGGTHTRSNSLTFSVCYFLSACRLPIPMRFNSFASVCFCPSICVILGPSKIGPNNALPRAFALFISARSMTMDNAKV